MRLAIWAFLLAATPGYAQPESEVRKTVSEFLERLGGLRFYALEEFFTEDANIVIARSTRSGVVPRVVSAREWLEETKAGTSPRPFREELANVEVAVESESLAMVRGDFRIVRDDAVESSGVDFFTLVRKDGRWRIASIGYTSVPTSLAPSLEARLSAWLDALDAKSSLYARHLPSGREVAVRADVPMNTLSVIKIAIMVLAYRDAEAGRLDLDARYRVRPEDRRRGSGLLQTFSPGLEPTYRDLVTQMIVTSDNTATDILIERLGLERVNALLEERGYESTRLETTTGQLFRRVWELLDPENAGLTDVEVFDRGFPNDDNADERRFAFEGDSKEWLGRTTAREMSQLLEEIYQGRIVSRESSDAMIDILKRQFYSSRLPRFIRFEVPVAHKTGDWPPVAGNDVGILFHRGGPTVISVFVNQNRGDFDRVEETIGEIAREIVAAWSEEKR